jgi:hypothetical protein
MRNKLMEGPMTQMITSFGTQPLSGFWPNTSHRCMA